MHRKLVKDFTKTNENTVRMYGGKFEIQKTKTPEGKSYVLMNLPYFLDTKLEDYLLFFLENHPENEIS